MKMIKVKDVMTVDPFFIKPNQSVLEAARLMRVVGCGVLPVGSEDKVVGIITDRDIVVRVVSEDKNPETTKVQDVMTKKVYSCDESDGIEHAAEIMREHNVSRLLVIKGKRVAGIISTACLLRNKGNVEQSDKVLHGLLGCAPHSEHSSKKLMVGCGCD